MSECGEERSERPLGSFELLKTSGRARLGRFHTHHGSFDTPAFMPVGTQATVKGMLPRDLKEVGAQIILANTYHLALRPGEELIGELGGLHQFMQWDGPILTDSGGFQVFSLAKLRQVTDDGVTFHSHVDGAKVCFTPERVVQIQERLGVDIMMVLDECLPYPSPVEVVERSWVRTLRWAERSLSARKRRESLCFGIVQGGMYPELRIKAAQDLTDLGFDGYAIGGLSVGEPQAEMFQIAGLTTEVLPQDRIRYLMGVGMPSDLVGAVARGVDLFDCVIPTRSARFGRLFTQTGFLNIRNQVYRSDPRPVDEHCDCYTCENFSRAYLAHLTHAKEILAIQLGTLHNLRYYQRLMSTMRQAIAAGTFADFAESFLAAAATENEKN